MYLRGSWGHSSVLQWCTEISGHKVFTFDSQSSFAFEPGLETKVTDIVLNHYSFLNVLRIVASPLLRLYVEFPSFLEGPLACCSNQPCKRQSEPLPYLRCSVWILHRWTVFQEDSQLSGCRFLLGPAVTLPGLTQRGHRGHIVCAQTRFLVHEEEGQITQRAWGSSACVSSAFSLWLRKLQGTGNSLEKDFEVRGPHCCFICAMWDITNTCLFVFLFTQFSDFGVSLGLTSYHPLLLLGRKRGQARDREFGQKRNEGVRLSLTPGKNSFCEVRCR